MQQEKSDFVEYLELMQEIHEAKNSDYSPEGEFGNFAESERVGIPAWMGAFIRLQDKYQRIVNLIRGKERKVKDEALEDTLLDLANYAIIVLCLRNKEAKDQKIQEIQDDLEYLPCCERRSFHRETEDDLK